MPPESPPRILVLLGSATPPGRLRGALDAAAERGRRDGLEVDLIDLAEHRLGFADGRDPAAVDDDSAELIAAVDDADAVIFATPVYRGSITGSLKNLLDLLPVPALAGKPVGIVAMGGSAHHFLGAERHLRDVLAFFGAVTMPIAVYLASADFPAGALEEGAARNLDELLAGTATLAGLLADSGAPLGPPNPLAPRAAAVR